MNLKACKADFYRVKCDKINLHFVFSSLPQSFFHLLESKEKLNPKEVIFLNHICYQFCYDDGGRSGYTNQITPDLLTADSVWISVSATSKEYTFVNFRPVPGSPLWHRYVA